MDSQENQSKSNQTKGWPKARNEEIPQTLGEQFDAFKQRSALDGEKNQKDDPRQDYLFGRYLLDKGYTPLDVKEALYIYSKDINRLTDLDERNSYVKMTVDKCVEDRLKPPTMEVSRVPEGELQFTKRYKDLLNEASEYGAFQKKAIEQGFESKDQLKRNPTAAYDLMMETGFLVDRPKNDKTIEAGLKLEGLFQEAKNSSKAGQELKDILVGYKLLSNGASEEEAITGIIKTSQNMQDIFEKGRPAIELAKYCSHVLKDSKDLLAAAKPSGKSGRRG